MSIYGDLIKQARSDETSVVVKSNQKEETQPKNSKKVTPDKNSKPLGTQVEVSTHKIELHPDQPRKYFDPETMRNLEASIRQDGVIEPLIVRPLDNGNYELVAGERRLRASKGIGLATVPIKICELTEAQARRIALVENLQREELNPVEEVEAILKLVALELNSKQGEEFVTSTVVTLLYRMQNEAKGKVTHNVMGSPKGEIVEDAFKSLGIAWKSFVSNKLPVLNWPEDVLQKAKTGKIAFENAKIIARVKDKTVREELLSQAVSELLSVADTKERIESLVDSNKKVKNSSLNSSDDATKILQVRVSQTFQRLIKKKTWEKVMSDKTKSARIHALIEEIETLMT
jgi:ParB family transcriptional regulator, chromosome partitioning protein